MYGGLNPQKTCEIVKKLNVYLADLFVHYAKLHNFHWNVVGIGFFDLHEKTEELYDAVHEEIDEIGERIIMLGYKPVASLKGALEYANIQEAPSKDYNSSTIAFILIQDFKIILALLREIAELASENNDEYTIQLVSDAIGFYEKNIWMMSAYLKRNICAAEDNE